MNECTIAVWVAGQASSGKTVSSVSEVNVRSCWRPGDVSVSLRTDRGSRQYVGVPVCRCMHRCRLVPPGFGADESVYRCNMWVNGWNTLPASALCDAIIGDEIYSSINEPGPKECLLVRLCS